MLQFAENFQNKLQEDKPWISIDLENYKGLKYEVSYHCSKHNYSGVASGAALAKSLGCPLCQQERHFYKTEEYYEKIRKQEAVKFIEKATKIHGDKYTYSVEWYEARNDSLTKIWCNTHLEFFYQRPAAHIQGQNCPKCGKESAMVNSRCSHEDFVNRWSKFNTNTKLTIVSGSFLKYHAPVKVQCETHGIFEITANNACIDNCCSLCKKEDSRTKNALQFISDAIAIHGDAYDYSLVLGQYVTNRTKVSVRCKRHDVVFSTTRNKHVDTGSGCPICAKDRTNRWTLSALEKDLNFYKNQACSVYLLRISSTSELFYKIGISKDMKVRVSLLQKELPNFKIEVVKENISNTYDSLSKEKSFHEILKSKRYTPSVMFGGYTECFVLDETYLDEVKSWFD